MHNHMAKLNLHEPSGCNRLRLTVVAHLYLFFIERLATMYTPYPSSFFYCEMFSPVPSALSVHTYEGFTTHKKVILSMKG